MAEHEEARRLADKIQAALRYYVPTGENREAALAALSGLLALLSKAEQERDEAIEAVRDMYEAHVADLERELERLREILARFDWDAEVRAALSADTQREAG